MIPVLLITITLADGRLACEAPGDWETVTPRINLIEKEFSIPAPIGSAAQPARVTVSTAGGSINANIARWVGQFRDTEGGADRSTAEIEEESVNGMPVTFVDVSGTFLESARGPFGRKTPREGYRMVAAIVETGFAGNYFFKLVGPRESVDPASEGFRAMVRSLEER